MWNIVRGDGENEAAEYEWNNAEKMKICVAKNKRI